MFPGVICGEAFMVVKAGLRLQYSICFRFNMQSHRTPFQPNLAAIQAARWFVGAWKAVSPLGSPGIDQQYGGSARLGVDFAYSHFSKKGDIFRGNKRTVNCHNHRPNSIASFELKSFSINPEE